MRRLLMVGLLVLVGSCGDHLLAPVNTLDGVWSGIQGGFSMSLSMTQSGSAVTGDATLGGVAGFATGSVAGSFSAPDVNLTITLDGANEPIHYVGTLSTQNAKIFAKLNGSGFVDQELDIAKK